MPRPERPSCWEPPRRTPRQSALVGLGSVCISGRSAILIGRSEHSQQGLRRPCRQSSFTPRALQSSSHWPDDGTAFLPPLQIFFSQDHHADQANRGCSPGGGSQHHPAPSHPLPKYLRTKAAVLATTGRGAPPWMRCGHASAIRSLLRCVPDPCISRCSPPQVVHRVHCHKKTFSFHPSFPRKTCAWRLTGSLVFYLAGRTCVASFHSGLVCDPNSAPNCEDLYYTELAVKQSAG